MWMKYNDKNEQLVIFVTPPSGYVSYRIYSTVVNNSIFYKIKLVYSIKLRKSEYFFIWILKLLTKPKN